ncbi:enoyl-CoA hydratase/isomerase family protein [Amycolatopsis pithecellobii]|uniref:Enoyl-CoA hydratase/isomerase family protein n=1 Tax=Amycolatopsis pithecellobii TaxID=664692 RepID=A0A6N7YZH1_9PSEU|nr:enoyl-CoA hydratase/isomerase family protein [Amycolatopsis pithecellobii]MTD53829.1 enoyl-CoA hydratase/isomerase family protein [Amycolatopsis pithecellobii]
MPQPWSRKQMYRTYLEEYSERWSEYFTFKREDGILEMRMHTEHDSAKWSLELHRAFIPALADVGHDPENEILIFSGTGEKFLDSMDPEGWERYGFREPMTFDKGYDFWYFDQVHEPFSLLNLEIPVIGAINGPFFIHQELALLNDIVIASESTTMADGHYTGMGIVPGDGVQTVFRELMGTNRAKYFLLTGQTMQAKELLDMGLIGEVVPDDQLLDRAWEIARTVFKPRARSTRAMTRALLVQPWRELLTRELPTGMAHECWGVHGYWGMAEEGYDIANLKKAED